MTDFVECFVLATWNSCFASSIFAMVGGNICILSNMHFSRNVKWHVVWWHLGNYLPVMVDAGRKKEMKKKKQWLQGFLVTALLSNAVNCVFSFFQSQPKDYCHYEGKRAKSGPWIKPIVNLKFLTMIVEEFKFEFLVEMYFPICYHKTDTCFT